MRVSLKKVVPQLKSTLTKIDPSWQERRPVLAADNAIYRVLVKVCAKDLSVLPALFFPTFLPILAFLFTLTLFFGGFSHKTKVKEAKGVFIVFNGPLHVLMNLTESLCRVLMHSGLASILGDKIIQQSNHRARSVDCLSLAIAFVMAWSTMHGCPFLLMMR